MVTSFRRSLFSAGFLLAVPALPGSAQIKAALTKPDAEYAEPFSQVSAVHELPNGKVLVVDQLDKIVQLVDLVSGTATKVGREGNGPGEYAFPTSLIGLPDGSTLVQDMLNRRFLIVAPEGKPGAFLEMPRPPAPGGGPAGAISLGGDMRADERGRIYFQGSAFGGPGSPPIDSVPIFRWDRASPQRLDTVGYVKLPARAAVTSGGAGRFEVRMGGQKVFTPAETWVVAGSGRIARVQPSPYRVIWIEGDKLSPGPVQPYTPIRVTEADKELVREARRRNPGIAFTISNGERSVSRAPAPNVSQIEFEETMPPFVAAAGAGRPVLATPDGEVWVLRTRPASDKVPSYDVFDRTGGLARKVTLNPNSRVVGFGKGTVYVVRTDEDDLQYLQRYLRP